MLRFVLPILIFCALITGILGCERIEVDPKQCDLDTPYMPDLGTGYPKIKSRGIDQKSPAETDSVYDELEVDIRSGKIMASATQLELLLPEATGKYLERAHYLKALLFLKSGQPDKAEQYALETLKHFPETAYKTSLLDVIATCRLVNNLPVNQDPNQTP